MNKGIQTFLILLTVAALVVSAALWLWHPAVQPIVVNHKPAPAPAVAIQPAITPVDPRVAILQTFLSKYNCVDEPLAAYYIQDADENSIDWRLLPAISFKESTCGKHYINNNLWGWESGAYHFASLSAGIDYISGELDMGPWYYGKTTLQKLQAYNGHPGYAESVLNIMQSISKEE